MTSRPLKDVLEGMGLLTSGEALRADLHTHSTASDGSCTFAELASQALQQGLTHIAFTNHDTTYGLTDALRCTEVAGLRGIGGIEVSAYDFKRNRKVHVLGLGVSENAPALAALCTPTLTLRDADTRRRLLCIAEAGYALDMEKFDRLASASTCAYKQHIMAALTEEPYNSPTYRKLYRTLLSDASDQEIKYVDARDAVRAIIEDGGHPVLAHPGQLDSWDFVPELVLAGLEGIEKYHRDHDPNDEAHVQALAERFGLFVTAGSDYHGIFGRPANVGEFRIQNPDV